jgi:2Fe-2S ferredoxin
LITLQGKGQTKTVPIEKGKSILQLALQHKIPWGHLCKNGTCARCRCLVMEGADLIKEPTEAEEMRLDEEELEEHYRLGCQAQLKKDGELVVTFKPYF